jgi:hypothetical protein
MQQQAGKGQGPQQGKPGKVWVWHGAKLRRWEGVWERVAHVNVNIFENFSQKKQKIKFPYLLLRKFLKNDT